jgi:hypothetical protein
MMASSMLVLSNFFPMSVRSGPTWLPAVPILWHGAQLPENMVLPLVSLALSFAICGIEKSFFEPGRLK